MILKQADIVKEVAGMSVVCGFPFIVRVCVRQPVKNKNAHVSRSLNRIKRRQKSKRVVEHKKMSDVEMMQSDGEESYPIKNKGKGKAVEDANIDDNLPW